MDTVTYSPLPRLMRALLPLALVLALVWLGAAKARAQVVPEAGVSFRLLGVGMKNEILRYPKAGNQMFAVRVRSSYAAGPYTLARQGPLRLYRKGESGEQIPVAEITLAAGLGSPLVLLFEQPSLGADASVLPYSGVVLDHSFHAAPLHSVRFINLADTAVAVGMENERPALLEPGKERIVPYRPRTDTDVMADLKLAARRSDGSWALISEEPPTLILEPNKRILVLLHSVEGRVAVQIIDDFQAQPITL